MTHITLRCLTFVLISTSLGGCSYLGYYKREKADRASPAEAERVEFPDSFDGSFEMKGPMAAALEIAMDEFLPPGTRVKARGEATRVAECLSRRSTYDILAMMYGDDLFYVSFSPRLERCGLTDEILDGGAEYILDGKGRILRQR